MTALSFKFAIQVDFKGNNLLSFVFDDTLGGNVVQVHLKRFENSLNKWLNRVATNMENMENLKNSGNLKNCQNLRENSGKFELLWKKPGKLRENEKYVT